MEITNVDDFANIVDEWHDTVIARLEHLLEVPRGTEVEVEDCDPKVLDGDYLDGFRLGVSLALETIIEDAPFLRTDD